MNSFSFFKKLIVAVGVTGLINAQTPEPVTPADQGDLATIKFMSSCAGCHSLAGQKLSGPPLNGVGAWSVGDLKGAIKRMEKHVGALTELEIGQLTEFLKAPDILERLKKEEARVALQFTAKMEPASALIGRGLYWGSLSFKNQGLACASCHAAEGKGGNLGPDLTEISAKMGETALVSSIEKSAFKIMEPHYRDHPVTKQEARHLAKYLGTLSVENQKHSPPFDFIVGFSLAAIFMIVMTIYYGRAKFGQRPRLQRRRK